MKMQINVQVKWWRCK